MGQQVSSARPSWRDCTPSPRAIERGIVFLIVAIALDLVLFGSVYYSQNQSPILAIAAIGLLGAALAFGALGFLRIYRSRVYLGIEGGTRLRLAWHAFLACLVLDGIIIVDTVYTATGLAPSPVAAYVLVGFLSSVATALVLLWTAQVLGPSSIYPVALLALLTGVSGSAIETNGLLFFGGNEIELVGRVLGLLSLVLWLLVFVEARLKQMEHRIPAGGPVQPA